MHAFQAARAAAARLDAVLSPDLPAADVDAALTTFLQLFRYCRRTTRCIAISWLLTPLGRDVRDTRPRQAVDGRVRRAGAAAPAEPAAGDQPAPAGPAGHHSRRGRGCASVRAGALASPHTRHDAHHCTLKLQVRSTSCSILAMADAVPDRARQLGRAALLPGAADALDTFFDGVFQHLCMRCRRGVVLTKPLHY